VVEGPPPALWGRRRIRPTPLGLLVIALVVLVTVTGWGRDATAVGLLRGVAVGVVVSGVVSALADLRSFSPGALVVPNRISVGDTINVGPSLGRLRPSIDVVVSSGASARSRLDGLRLDITPVRRGRYGSVTAEVSTVGAIGAFRVSRVGHIPFRSPMWVCPVPSEPVPLEAMAPAESGDDLLVATRAPGLTRGVRPMVTGDLIRHAHWSATARRGTVHVRDFERPSERDVHLRVVLTGDETVDAAIASRALATALDVVGRGAEVVVHVHRPDGPCAVTVDDGDSAARVLAEAVAGPLSPPPVGVPSVTISVDDVMSEFAPVAT
jgi:uncharacterized protein (DUF58 family)